MAEALERSVEEALERYKDLCRLRAHHILSAVARARIRNHFRDRAGSMLGCRLPEW
jgi:hypothetical protein